MAKGNIKEFIETDTKVDRLELLRGVTRGLVYMHDQRIIHGDLKGVNILIDDDGHPRIAGFDLVTVASERATMTPPPPVGGEIPWMSPELLFPEKFDLKRNNPTKKSDCYALGMVVYEVLSGQAPFAAYREVEIVRMVLGGERPERPRGDEGRLFTDEIWKVLGFCWEQRPGDRLSAKGILMGLDGNLSPSRPPSDIEDVETDTDDQQDEPGPTIARGDDGLAARPGRIGTKGRRVSDVFRSVTKFFRR
ncbi:kinase-like domain-containing protein [Thelephora terrestris]|uniref:Kinase-like domain-containing protein n=1 Tax=Thelephora terrestris TaxID=56493 RepID=A0A9P6HNK6_9AGAM|nr:kinase-like domain-containing protein [Thelephora terrestris]